MDTHHSHQPSGRIKRLPPPVQKPKEQAHMHEPLPPLIRVDSPQQLRRGARNTGGLATHGSSPAWGSPFHSEGD